MVSLLINVLISGCTGNLTKKSRYSYHGTFSFFQNNKKIEGPISSELYTKIIREIENIIFDFGFIRSHGESDSWFKNKNTSGLFSNYSGSEAAISLYCINRSDLFFLDLDDHTYKDRTTEFTKELIKDIISNLREKFDFSQIIFEETEIPFFR